MVDTDDAAPGWAAIDAALDQLYPGVEPKHYGTLLKWALGGPDPLDGLSVYPRADHWHFVSYGMSELYAKESDNADESGWGFEFTFRVARTAAESDPPMWAANFLQNLARYVFGSGNPFGPGHHLDLNGSISLAEPDTAIRAIAFADDPELGVIDTPHGRLRFLQIVGLTLDEYSAIERWDAEGLLAAMAPSLPLLVTDLRRGNLTDEPGVATAVEEGVRRDGSSTGSLFVQEAGWRMEKGGWARRKLTTTVTVGANAAERIGRVLRARLPFGRGLLIEAQNGSVGFRPGEQVTVTDAGDGFLEIELPPAVLPELIQVLRPVAGTYHLASAPELVVEIARSQIRDQEGAVVAEVG
ncbi:suppressor of fused domain protein [Micromonospora purpureochromogenes]|uniref:suppressor of fused domain protein n=1 Tax=Micromonospora purpureochromogenes TaxID=47872 RepID=UPI0036282420